MQMIYATAGEVNVDRLGREEPCFDLLDFDVFCVEKSNFLTVVEGRELAREL